MTYSVTPEDFVLFVCDEICDMKMKKKIADAIRKDNLLYEEYLSASDILKSLDISIQSPSETIISNVLAYADAMDVVDVKPPAPKTIVKN